MTKPKKRALRALTALLSVLFWVGVWWLVALKIGKPLLLPAPPAVLARLLELIFTAEFWQITGLSLFRILLGIFLSVAVAVPLALVTASLPAVGILLRPLMTAVRATPVAAFIVLLWLFIGGDEVPTIITVLIALPVVWKNVETGILEIDRGLLQMAKVFRLPLPKRLLRIDLPAVLPAFKGALQTAVGLGWKAGIAAEILVRPIRAIGREISDANYNLESVDLFAWTLTVVLLSLVIELLVSVLFSRPSRKVTPTVKGKEEAV